MERKFFNRLYEKNREILRENSEYGVIRESLEYGIMRDMSRKIIGVTGIGKGAGATFIAMNLAFKLGEMAENVTFAEGQPCGEERISPYILLGVDSKFKRMRLTDFFKMQEDGDYDAYMGSRVNLYKNVNWAIRIAGGNAGQPGANAGCCGGQPTSFNPCAATASAPDYRRLAGKYIIVDDPDSEHMEEADLIIAVVDPLPARILAGLDTYERLRKEDARASGRKIIWVMNKSNNQVNRREAERFLKQKFDLEMELIPEEIFYNAQYNCTQPFFITQMRGIELLAKKVLSDS